MVRGGHFKLIMKGGPGKLIQFAEIHYTKWHNIWLTLSTDYPINQEGCPTQGTTPLGQAVCNI